jgi:hypothetical protein
MKRTSCLVWPVDGKSPSRSCDLEFGGEPQAGAAPTCFVDSVVFQRARSRRPTEQVRVRLHAFETPSPKKLLYT